MSKLRDEDYEKFRELSNDHGHKYDSEVDMRRSADNLVQFFEVLIKIDQEELARKNRLNDEPKGFSMLGEGRNCSLCGDGVYGGYGWYDKWGFKCTNCQDAINKERYPAQCVGTMITSGVLLTPTWHASRVCTCRRFASSYAKARSKQGAYPEAPF